jgi:cell division protein FtsB
MDLNKYKSENFWLRAGFTTMIVVWLSTLAVMNRGIIQERKTLTDSAAYYKNKYLELDKQIDSLQTEKFSVESENGRYELGLDFLKERNPNEYNLVKHFIDTQTE